MELPIVTIFALPMFVTPVLLVIVWRMWLIEAKGNLPQWRRTAFLIGFVVLSSNAALYYAWLAYRVQAGGTPYVWHLKDLLADDVGIAAALFAMGCGLMGTNWKRLLVFCGAAMEVLLWSNLGIL